MKLIRQRYKDDCAIASIAMILDLEYEQIAERLQRSPSDGQILLCLLSLGKAAVCIPLITKDPFDVITDLSNEVTELITDKPGLLTVIHDKGRHLVAWDGRFVYDPARSGPQLLSRYILSDAFLLFTIK